MFPSFLAQATTTQVEEIRWLQMPPPWVVVLVIVPVVILFASFFYRRENPTGGSGWRWLLGGLRVAVVLSVIFMMFRPVQTKTTYETRDSILLVLIDDSLSMEISDRYSNRETPELLAELLRTSSERIEETSRYGLLERLLADTDIKILDRLRGKARVIVSTFARSVQEVAELPRLRHGGNDMGEAPEPADGAIPPYSDVRNSMRVQETRIMESLRDAVANALGSRFGEQADRVTGVLLFTDGQENAGTASLVEVGGRLGQRGIPVYTIGVGNPDEPKDVRVTNVDVNEIVLVGEDVPFHATVVADGFEGQRVRVQLKIDSQPVLDEEGTSYVLLEGSGKPQTVRLSYRPRNAGEYMASVEVEELGGEVFYDNNSLSKPIRVLDQKIKVLYIENLPRWEYRFLKNALIRDPTMEAQVYLISADRRFSQESSRGVPSLTALPDDRKTLMSYHVIILGDVEPEKHLGAETMKLLKEFVLEGGGLVFLSGPHANPARYRHTDLYGVLPVELGESDPVSEGTRGPAITKFNVRLTPVGQAHQVMRLDSDPEQNVRLWENSDGAFYDHLPGFYWYAEVGPKKAGAVVLARHPQRLHPIYKKGLVIFAFMKYGNGYSFFSAVDGTWRWRAGVENLYLGRFWGQVIRFVASGRLVGKSTRFKLSTDKAVYQLGEAVRIDCRVRDANMKPSSEPVVTVYHQTQGRENEPPEKIELPLNTVLGQGTYQGAITADQRGRHDLWLGTESVRLVSRSFTVEVPALESRDPRLNRDFLRRLAVSSGGEYFELTDVLKAVERLKGVSRSTEGLVEEDDLWDEWWIVVLFTALISLEWILRKGVRLL